MHTSKTTTGLYFLLVYEGHCLSINFRL